MNFRFICSSSLKNAVGILIGVALNLYIALGRVAILTILILPIHEHGTDVHFLGVFNVSHECLVVFRV